MSFVISRRGSLHLWCCIAIFRVRKELSCGFMGFCYWGKWLSGSCLWAWSCRVISIAIFIEDLAHFLWDRMDSLLIPDTWIYLFLLLHNLGVNWHRIRLRLPSVMIMDGFSWLKWWFFQGDLCRRGLWGWWRLLWSLCCSWREEQIWEYYRCPNYHK